MTFSDQVNLLILGGVIGLLSALIGAVVQHLLETRRYKVQLKDQEQILQKQFKQQGEALLQQHQLALEEDLIKRAREESEQRSQQLRDSLTQGLKEYMAQGYPSASELRHLKAQVNEVIRQERLTIKDTENTVQTIQRLLTAYDELSRQDIEQLIQVLTRLQAVQEDEQHLSNFVNDLQHDLIWHHHDANDAKGSTWSAIAAEAGRLNYNYPFIVYFLKLKNKNRDWRGNGTPYEPVPIPSVQEFIEILEIRRDQIKKVIDMGDLLLKWEWPDEWGYVPWKGPIIHTDRIQDLSKECYLDHALREYSQTKTAISQYRTLHDI